MSSIQPTAVPPMARGNRNSQRTKSRVSGPGTRIRPTITDTFLDDQLDAFIVLQAVRMSRLTPLPRRPEGDDRDKTVRHGTVLVYEESNSGITRYTDPRNWSPSRMLGSWLLYREVNAPPAAASRGKRKAKKIRKAGRVAIEHENPQDHATLPPRAVGAAMATTMAERGRCAGYPPDFDDDDVRRYLGSLTASYDFREGGLMKKTVTIDLHGKKWHLINYYDPFRAKELRRPVDMENLWHGGFHPDCATRRNTSGAYPLADVREKEIPDHAGYRWHFERGYLNMFFQGEGNPTGDIFLRALQWPAPHAHLYPGAQQVIMHPVQQPPYGALYFQDQYHGQHLVVPTVVTGYDQDPVQVNWRQGMGFEDDARYIAGRAPQPVDNMPWRVPEVTYANPSTAQPEERSPEMPPSDGTPEQSQPDSDDHWPFGMS